MKYYASLFLLLLLPLITFGQKNKRPGLFGRAYHDITARNNIYFNAHELLKSMQKSMRESHVDDYSTIIPIYIDRDPQFSASFAADLDKIIIKGSKEIEKHNPARWTDDSHLIVGISYFYKSDFENSTKSFQYVLTKYKEKKKKKKSKGKPQAASYGNASKNGSKGGSKSKSKKPMTATQMKAAALEAEKEEEDILLAEAEKKEDLVKKTGFDENKYYKESFKEKLRHKKSRPLAYVWLIDNYTFANKYKEAEAVITILDAQKSKIPFRLSDELEIAKANLYLHKQDYDKALESFKIINGKIKRYKKKNRYYFIVAQIHEREKNYSEAIKNYKKSLKGRPKYDMQFAAVMSIARISSEDQSTPLLDIRKKLTKMTKDIKNKEFLDQIYFYLAELCLRENNMVCAKENLEKSVESSTSNTKQKIKAHLKLADIYFKEEDYREAEKNYSSAFSLIDSKYPNYRDIKFKSEVLKQLITQLDIVYLQDSLLKIANLPEFERNKFIDNLLFEKEKEEKKESATPITPSTAPKSSSAANDSGGSNWYFYNTAQKSTGFNDFTKKWGKRTLGDDWRRNDKSKDVFEETETTEEALTAEKESKNSLTERDALLKNFPIEEDTKNKANASLLDALYEVGTIYKVKLHNNKKGIETFEDILKRFPSNKYLGQIYYNLYLLHKEDNNLSQANHYKDLLIAKFPNSPYLQYILNPNFLAEQQNKFKHVEDYYKSTFAYYKNGDYAAVLSMTEKADSLFEENNLKPKFELLHAFALGKTAELKEYKEALLQITKKYDGDEAAIKAKEILDYLDNSSTKEVRIKSNIADFDYLLNDGHYFMLMFENKDIKTTDITNQLANWNDTNRSLESLKINSLILKDNITTVVVKSFKNAENASKYLSAVKNTDFIKKLPSEKIHLSIISENNFNLIVKHREIDSYKVFYEARYTQ